MCLKIGSGVTEEAIFIHRHACDLGEFSRMKHLYLQTPGFG